jgi:hypothetical protein
MENDPSCEKMEYSVNNILGEEIHRNFLDALCGKIR